MWAGTSNEEEDDIVLHEEATELAESRDSCELKEKPEDEMMEERELERE